MTEEIMQKQQELIEAQGEMIELLERVIIRETAIPIEKIEPTER